MDFTKPMLSRLCQPAESYHYHLTRQSFNLVAERLEYPPMRPLDDPTPPEPMMVPPARFGIDPGRTMGTAYQSNVEEEKQWLEKYLRRRVKNPKRVAQYLAAWEKNYKICPGKGLVSLRSTAAEGSHQPTSGFLNGGEERCSIYPGAQQPVPPAPLSQVNIGPSPQSLTPASALDLTKRLQTIRPPQRTNETHDTINPKESKSKSGLATRPRRGNAQRPSQEPRATSTLSLYDFCVLSLVLLAPVLWFFMKVCLVLTYKILAWFLSVLARKTTWTIRGWIRKTTAAMKQRLRTIALEAKKTVEEVLE